MKGADDAGELVAEAKQAVEEEEPAQLIQDRSLARRRSA
tara:strand:- start:788 stop:904 length:117 start_codon:yes stop_codon:yes gene_type:complete